MEFLIYIDTISMGLPIVYFKGSQVEFSILSGTCVFMSLSLKVVLISTYSADPDETGFHLGLHCLQKYPFRGYLYIKG